jgi:hypothetical protein
MVPVPPEELLLPPPEEDEEVPPLETDVLEPPPEEAPEPPPLVSIPLSDWAKPEIMLEVPSPRILSPVIQAMATKASTNPYSARLCPFLLNLCKSFTRLSPIAAFDCL